MQTNEIREGSLRQLWKISCSLMISFFSMVAMIFCDRLYLANYSVSSLSAAVSAGTFWWGTTFAVATICSMAEVFVAQYNGAKRYKKLGEPVWQMIWFALFSIVFFFSLGTVVNTFLYEVGFFNVDEMTYFKWNNFFAPSFALLAAISAFFIGQGKTRIIQWMALLGNTINIILDPLLIFGVKGWIPEMGLKGAAIATGIGIIIQIIILGALFLRLENKRSFGTGNWKFRPLAFWKCLKIGFTPGIFFLSEIFGWALFYKMMETISPKHIIVSSVTQSILILLLFFAMAIEKGAAAVTGNLIGSKQLNEVKRVLKSGTILTLFFAVILIAVLIGCADLLIDWFFRNPAALEGDLLLTQELMFDVKSTIKFALATLILYLTFENIRYMLSGMLTAAGDTVFLMTAGTASILICLLVPTYFLMVVPKGPIEIAFFIWIFYSGTDMAILYWRFKKNKWRKKHLIETC
ncbi:MAG: MATE family efflux transporter [Simkania sp.]|nr:MATE family efflux transporter [Simkania sp.]